MESKWKQVCPNLSEHTLEVVARLGFESMTPVQVATIPTFLKKKDVCVEAVTGSGKTLAFVIPLLEMLQGCGDSLKSNQIGAIIISPTRELASQIFDVLEDFYDASKCPLKSMLCIGGKGNIGKDIAQFASQGAQILVGTPGRISYALESCQQMQVGVKALEVLILDEADRLLDLGFHKTLTNIMRFLPKQRRTGLFSATQTDEVEQLIKAGMRNPVKIAVKEKKELLASDAGVKNVKTPSSLVNQYLICGPSQKFCRLMNFIANRKDEKILVFFSTCASVEYFGRAVKDLLGSKWSVLLLHGKVKKRRLQIFCKFRQIESGVLICTDVMARGVDIPDVDWVLQYDPPSNASAFVHRCGRTARVGRKGNALIFLLENESSYVDFIEINQKAPMVEFNAQAGSGENWLTRLRVLSLEDRAMMERGTRAFVSFVQAYAKHECNLIFRLKDLKLGELATGFGLLRLPRMPELKNRKITGFAEGDVDTRTIPYKDKVREQQRQEELKRRASSDVDTRPKYMSKKAKAWTESKQKKETRKLKKLKRKQRKEKVTLNDDELEELRKDAQMVKKLKNKKISKEVYDEEIEAEEGKLESSLATS